MVPGAVLQLAEAEIGKRLVPFQRLDVARRHRLAVLGQQLVQQGDGRLGCPAINILLCQLALGNQALDRVRFRREVGFQVRDLLLLQVPRIVPGALLLGDRGERLDHVEALPLPHQRRNRDHHGDARQNQPGHRRCGQPRSPGRRAVAAGLGGSNPRSGFGRGRGFATRLGGIRCGV